MSTAVFMNVSGGGHVIATYGLVRELVKRGEIVHYFEDPLYKDDLEALGAIFHPMPTAEPLFIEAVGGPFHHELDLALAMVWCSKFFVPSLLPQVRNLSPDYLVHDSLCLWGKIIASKLNIPGICSVHPPAFNLKAAFFCKRMWLDFPKMLLQWQKIRSIFKKIKSELEKEYDQPTIGFYESFTNPQELTICHLPAELQPFRACFDERYHFVGSVHRRPNESLSKLDLNELKRGLIYVGFGTICDPGIEFFKTCIRALSKINRQALVILSHSTSKRDIGPVPSNIMLWSLKEDGMAPQMDILPLASLFIMNGGTGGSRESCWYGVPMLAIPTTFETECVSLQMQKMGAGLVLNKSSNESEIGLSINLLLNNPSFAERSRFIGQQCRKSGGANYAANLILEHVKNKTRLTSHL